MSWQAETVGILRVLIDDMDDTAYRYSDSRLNSVIAVAARYVLTDAGAVFNSVYTITITPSVSIDPDPSEDTAYTDLTVLKAACIIDQTEARRAAKNSGFAIKEFSSSIDTKGLADARIKLLSVGACKAYDDALFSFQAGDYVAGSAILGPFRTYYTSEYSRR